MSDEQISIRAAARLAQVHENTVRNWVKTGRLPSQMLPGPSGYHRVNRSDLAAFIPRTDAHNDIWGWQDDCLIAIQDGRPIPEESLRRLPPWRAAMVADVAVRAGCYTAEAASAIRAEATAIGGLCVLGAVVGGDET